MAQRRVIAAIVVAACGIAATALAGQLPDPKGLVLQESDMEAFELSSSRRVSNEAAAKGMPAGWRQKLERWGRVRGFEAEFEDSISDRHLRSSAGVYRTASGARAYLAAVFRTPPAPRGLRRLAPGIRLGQETRLYVQFATSQGVRLQLYYLAWRNRNVVGGIVLAGKPGFVNAAETRFLGDTQDARIRRALGRS